MFSQSRIRRNKTSTHIYNNEEKVIFKKKILYKNPSMALEVHILICSDKKKLFLVLFLYCQMLLRNSRWTIVQSFSNGNWKNIYFKIRRPVKANMMCYSKFEHKKESKWPSSAEERILQKENWLKEMNFKINGQCYRSFELYTFESDKKI